MEKEEFSTNIKTISKRVKSLKDSLDTEEATKTSLIMPFFQTLGYDIFNPSEFIPEYTADVGIKKGEKVDYAIVLDDKLQILVEAKAVSEELTKHDSQLFRYFGTTDAKFSILTNGDEYKFYTDLDQPNKMDAAPFLKINLSKLRDNQINELFKFTKDNFNVEKITSSASELKYVDQVKDFFSNEQKNPDSEFTKYVMGAVYDGRKTESAIEDFKPIISTAITQLINEEVNDKLSNALNAPVSIKEENSKDKEKSIERSAVETTPEEIEAYATVKIISKDIVNDNRIFYRDNQSYFNVLLDDNIRKWILRVYFTNTHNFIELNDGKGTKLDFTNPTDIYNYSDDIKEVIKILSK
ncbi:type I restriction enzyme HsdR N-terminal domain-containing protein [Lactobacillus sp. YT155]|uniref:type I restriction endonuclease n=1 Tax=Lactobacillus sp. YT155 TaxID=3060955 RepID=UPI00266047EF|nr:type I restriction endonuclease [Lactobacillus sp. YT155]MDO1605935.1 type I restriction enzyme HsdR N-terminal domain-containing protein [Lactobacillus sp. YT155]